MRLVFLFFLLIAHYTGYSQTSDLTVTVTNIKSSEGTIQVGLYNNEKAFPHRGKEYEVINLKASAPELTFTIKNIPPGEYGIALFHDINSDGKVNKNIIGVPKEGYGFSNNVKPLFSAPSFGKVKFEITSDTSITISLIH